MHTQSCPRSTLASLNNYTRIMQIDFSALDPSHRHSLLFLNKQNLSKHTADFSMSLRATPDAGGRWVHIGRAPQTRGGALKLQPGPAAPNSPSTVGTYLHEFINLWRGHVRVHVRLQRERICADTRRILNLCACASSQAFRSGLWMALMSPTLIS